MTDYIQSVGYYSMRGQILSTYEFVWVRMNILKHLLMLKLNETSINSEIREIMKCTLAYYVETNIDKMHGCVIPLRKYTSN